MQFAFLHEAAFVYRVFVEESSSRGFDYPDAFAVGFWFYRVFFFKSRCEEFFGNRYGVFGNVDAFHELGLIIQERVVRLRRYPEPFGAFLARGGEAFKIVIEPRQRPDHVGAAFCLSVLGRGVGNHEFFYGSSRNSSVPISPSLFEYGTPS